MKTNSKGVNLNDENYLKDEEDLKKEDYLKIKHVPTNFDICSGSYHFALFNGCYHS